MKTISLRAINLFLSALISIAVVFSMAACASEEDRAPSGEDHIVGSVASLSDGEMLVDASFDSSGFLQGPVRVDITTIDASTANELSVGIEVEIYYSGQVGMSEPPFISAQRVTIK